MVPRSAIKAGGKNGAVALGAMLFFFQVTATLRWSPVFLEVAEHLPANGRPWLNFALLARAAFTLPINLPLSQPTGFHTLAPPSWQGASERLCGVSLPTRVKPQQRGKSGFFSRRVVGLHHLEEHIQPDRHLICGKNQDRRFFASPARPSL